MLKFNVYELPEYTRSRSVLYQFFAQLMFQEPSKQSWNWMLHDMVFESLQEIFEDNNYVHELIAGLKQLEENSEMQVVLVGDYQNLFKIPGSHYLFPYESCYLEKGIDGSKGFVMGESTKRVSELYKMAGVLFTIKEIDDYIAMEFLFMHFLSKQEAELLEQNKNKEALHCRDWQRRFLNEHLFRWTDDFFQEMQNKAETTFYQSIAQLAADFIREEKEVILNTTSNLVSE